MSNPNNHPRPRRFHHVPGTDPYVHQRTRQVQEATVNDTRSLRRMLLAGGVAAVAAVSLNALRDDTSAEGGTPPVTTTVRAGEGASYWSLQQAEGDSGRDIREVVSDAMELPENDQKGTGDSDGVGDGIPDEIHPGMEVTLIDDPSTPPRP